MLAFVSTRRSAACPVSGASVKSATPPAVPTQTLSPSTQSDCTRSLGSPSKERSVRRKLPSGARRAIPPSAVPAQSVPLGATARQRRSLEGRPEGELRIFR